MADMAAHQSLADPAERRHSFRVPGCFGDRDHVLLRIRGREVAADLIDQSADGFSVKVPVRRARLRVGDKVLVGARATWHASKVVRVEKDGRHARLGLQLIEDESHMAERHVERGNPLLGTLLVLVAVAAIVRFAIMIFYHQEPSTGVLHRTFEEWGVSHLFR